jgi:CspA family cold shock protein
MSEQASIVECQRCGCRFSLTPTYRDWLARRGVKVVRPMLCPTCFMKVGPLPKQRGIVKWFNPHRRCGFIVAEEGEEVFFHQRQIVKGRVEETHEGRTVRFHMCHARKGPEALNVELIGE